MFALLAALPLALPLVPAAKEVSLSETVLKLSNQGRIVTGQVPFPDIGPILQGDLQKSTGLSMPVVAMGKARKGDIVLSIAGKPDTYSIEITDRIEIHGGSYPALVEGATTLVQALAGKTSLPKGSIRDWPDYPYRGVMIDLARKVHTIDGLCQIVDLCRFYKIPYLHLHLSDDNLFMFPSVSQPQAGKGNHEFAYFEPPSTDDPVKPYSKWDLLGLDHYAQVRGVTIIPEIDMPGHDSRLTEDVPDVFRATAENGATINMASDKTLAAAKKLLDEVMEIFPSSPFVHLGGDEVWMGGLDKQPDFVKAVADLNLKGPHELYRRFISEMNSEVKKQGKRMIVWEEAYSNEPGERWPLPKDTIVMAWSVNGPIQKILDEGYTMINAGWTPLYIVRGDKRSGKFILTWSPDRFGPHSSVFKDFAVHTGKGLIGAQICSWENPECSEIQSLRSRLAALAERTWNGKAAPLDLAFGMERFNTQDAILEKLINTVSIIPHGQIFHDENTFHEPLPVEMTAPAGTTIRYRLDNRLPTPSSPAYSGPITLTDSAWIRAAAFDKSGKQIGPVSGAWFNCVAKYESTLSLLKPVSATDAENNSDPKLIVDGDVDREHYWSGKTPSSVTVDLKGDYSIGSVNLLTYWDRGRYYQFTIEGSMDKQNWTMLVDASANTTRATPYGYMNRVPAGSKAHYIRVNMLKNSANGSTQIVELMVHEAK